MHILYK